MYRMYRKVHSESCVSVVIVTLLLGIIATYLDSPLDTHISEVPGFHDNFVGEILTSIFHLVDLSSQRLMESVAPDPALAGELSWNLMLQNLPYNFLINSSIYRDTWASQQTGSIFCRC